MSQLAKQLIAENKRQYKAGNLETAKFLDLGKCGLKNDIPEELFELKWLERLNFGDWYKNKQEKYVDSKNYLSNNIFSNAGSLKDLKRLKSLNSLYFGYNYIQDYSFLKELKSLNSLYLGDNQLDLSDSQIQDYSFFKELKSLNTLYLSDNQIQDISFLKELKSLNSLYLSDNQIQDYSFLKDLKSLNTLDLSFNQIQDISFLKDLKSLNSLYLGFNQIQGISFLKDLKSLNTLYLSDNQIQDISFLKDLKSLNTLYLSDNQIQDYSFLKDLKSLNSLYLSNNQIQDISFLKDLESLNTLDLRSNQIQDIQPLLFLIKKGISVKWEDYSERSVMLYSNPISNPPIEIVKEGNEAILNYFAELDKQGEVPLYEAKMLIIGESGAGKTTLARKLQNVTADIPQENETTKGIDIHRLDFKTEEEHGFRINMWDFGGQEIYHATHQFFLTKRSLYVLVTDNRKEDTDFNYWLQTVELLGGKSPILIIQNEKSERTKDINIKGMKAQYSELKDSFSTNLFTNKGLDKIEKAVRYHIQSLPLVGQMLPKQWVNIRNALEALEESGVPYISLERYYQICADHEIKEEKRALFLAQYLHDLGVFLHFQKDMLLRKTIVLQNEWATDAVYQVLDCKAVIEKHGQFDEADLATIWAASEYKNMHAELLKLMETFEMCYKITDSNQYLAPQLLPASAPDDYTWDEKENLILRLKYDFLPKGLVSRLMVRNHHLIKDIKQSWKSGVVFEYQETKAEVVELYGQGEIVIRVKGNRCRDLMTIIVKDFEQLHSKYEDIKVEKLIPCHCQQCISKKQKEKYYFSFTVLQNAEQKNINKIQCQKSFDEVEVQRLINDTFIADKIRKAERDRLNYIQEEKDNSITINNIINQPTMPESKPTPSSPEPSSIWAYASIFIIVMAVLLAALSILSIVKSLILITGGILFITLLATLQLQNDSRIKETNFMKLMTMVLKKIPPISFFVKKEK